MGCHAPGCGASALTGIRSSAVTTRQIATSASSLSCPSYRSCPSRAGVCIACDPSVHTSPAPREVAATQWLACHRTWGLCRQRVGGVEGQPFADATPRLESPPTSSPSSNDPTAGCLSRRTPRRTQTLLGLESCQSPHLGPPTRTQERNISFIRTPPSLSLRHLAHRAHKVSPKKKQAHSANPDCNLFLPDSQS